MEGQRRRRISIVGAGNVASNIAPALDRVADVVQVYSRDISRAREVASMLKSATVTDSLNEVNTDVDAVIIAVSDDAVAEVAASLSKGRAVVAHTSGSVPADAIPGPRNGVFYALQTFSKGKPVDFDEIPFFIEAADAQSHKLLHELASALSSKVYDADSRYRAALHVAAVFACNFANCLWADADSLLRPYGYDITVFGPLLRETLDKALKIGPFVAQTGPAMRRDSNVIDLHKEKLNSELEEIYDLMTRRIISTHFPEDKV